MLLALIGLLITAVQALAPCYSFYKSQQDDVATRWANYLRAAGVVRVTLPFVGYVF
jgi:hypothetical protein